MLYQVACKKAKETAIKHNCTVYVSATLAWTLHDGMQLPSVDHTAYRLSYWDLGRTVAIYGPKGEHIQVPRISDDTRRSPRPDDPGSAANDK
jgi:hypothetical protein